MKNTDSQRIKVLHLSRWYPNRYDPMPGLFIQRHAEAVSKYCDVGVVYVHAVEYEEQTQRFELQLEELNRVPTARVYYKNPCKNLPLIGKLIKVYRFYKANKIGIRAIKTELERIDLIHVHILTRLGVIALYNRLFRNVPYVISEHWSRYLPLTNEFRGGFRKWVTRIVVKHASAVTTVTQNLANAMQNHGLKNSNYQVLANVVTDDFLKFPKNKNPEDIKTTFIHVSCFEDKSKNISGLLHVILSLSKKRNDFIFKLVGDGMDFEFLKQYALDLGLDSKTIEFTGLLEGKELVNQMATADLMVVFSNYENFPVVINESFALGIPVIATAVGGIPEFVNNDNGRLLEAGNQIELENLLHNYLDGKLQFDSRTIMKKARQQFSPDEIAKELFNLYLKALN
ncbi:MAG: glycosyltransferase [Bacteroidetes bacterium]|nr:glycosyltransferase [Bacteroidota bacterium]